MSLSLQQQKKKKMKPHRKGKISWKEFGRLREIGYNYHKFLWTKFKRRIPTKRLI